MAECQRPGCSGEAKYGVEAVPLHRGKIYRKRTDLKHRWCEPCADALVNDPVVGRFTLPKED